MIGSFKGIFVQAKVPGRHTLQTTADMSKMASKLYNISCILLIRSCLYSIFRHNKELKQIFAFFRNKTRMALCEL